MAAQRESSWKGLYTNLSPHDNPPGTTVLQINMQNVTPGVLSVRHGIVPLAYTGFTSAGANTVFAMLKYDTAVYPWIVYELSNGTVKAIRDGQQVTLRTGMNPAQPISGVRDRRGQFMAVNGIDRGLFWDGLWSASELLGIDGPTSAATIGTASGGNATAGTYYGAYRFVDIYGKPSNLSTPVTITAADNNKFSWSALLTSLQNRCSSGGTKELFRTTSGESDTYYFVASTTAGATTYNDTLADSSLSAATNTFISLGQIVYNLPVFYPNGNLYANRFVPPPTQKPFMAIYRDRAWYYGNVIYNTGTIEVQSGSQTTLRGTGTAWTSQIVGKYYQPVAGGANYLISAYTSATSLTLSTSAPIVAAGALYSIINGPNEQRLIYFSEADEPESVPATNALPLQENMQDHDAETGLVAHDAYLYILHERHTYALNFSTQPALDAGVRPVGERGCINNHCWVVASGTLYLLDQLGVWSMGNDSGITPRSDQIQDYWRNGTLDFSTSSYWWGEYEPSEKVVRWFVTFTGDSGRPARALCYCPFANAWWTETYPWQLGHGCRTTIAGMSRLVVGSTLDTLYKTNNGLADGITTAVRGTATSGSGTTLTDSGASFASTVVGAPVAIVAGTSKGSYAVITARTSTQLTVASWTNGTPDSTSAYLIGAIPWSFQTGLLTFTVSEEMQIRRIIVTFKPTTNANSFDVLIYLNNNTSPEVMSVIDYDRGDGSTYTHDGTAAIVNTLVNQLINSQKIPGRNFVPFDGGVADECISDRFVSTLLQGYQGLDLVLVYIVDILGVE